MPYVTCGRCGLRTFSAAYWSNVDGCAGCGAKLPRARRKLVPIARRGDGVTAPSLAPPDQGGGHFARADD